MNDLSGYIIVTGATGGIGGAICRKIVAAGGSVIATCRDSKRGNAFVSELRQLAAAGADVRCEQLRLDDIDSIHGFCRRVEGLPISSLISNAGVMCRNYSLVAGGLEQTMAVNYFGTVLLAKLLLPVIERDGSMVFTTSITRRLHSLSENILCPSEKDFSQLGTYGRSKLALTHYAMYLAEECAGRLRVNCADPGVVNSGMITMHRWFDPLANLFFRPFISSPGRGAESALQACRSQLTGMIFHHSHSHPIGKELQHDASHYRLITQTEEWLKQNA